MTALNADSPKYMPGRPLQMICTNGFMMHFSDVKHVCRQTVGTVFQIIEPKLKHIGGINNDIKYK